jgi:hypothetical protein
MIHILLSLIALTPLTEPLILTTGEEVSAKYMEPSDEFCLKLEDFAAVQHDLTDQKLYWDGRLQRKDKLWIEKLTEIQHNHKAVHKSYLEEQELFKAELKEALKQRDLARSDLWWWRGATVGLILSTGVTIVYLIAR